MYFDSNKISQRIKLKINKSVQCPGLELIVYGLADWQLLAKRDGIVQSKYLMG